MAPASRGPDAIFMKPTASLVLGLLFSLLPAAHGAPVKFWVATDGDDSSPGTKEEPFLTLERARDAVRDADTDTEIVVHVRGGLYRLKETLHLDRRDSGRKGHDVVYRAVDGEHPVISGAIPVPGKDWAVHDTTLGIWSAKVGSVETRQLYVNGKRATRARTELVNGTNYPAGFLPKRVVVPGPPVSIEGGIQFIPAPTLNPGWWNPMEWKNVRDIEAVILTQWKMMSVPLDSITAGQITLQQPAWHNANLCFATNANAKVGPGIWSFWQVTRFENAKAFLDRPGEWYLDKAKEELYYIPRAGEDMRTAKVELPILEVLVHGEGEPGRPISNIRFEGLTFSHATWLEPNGGRLGGNRSNGYVTDQSGFRLEGPGHKPNFIGHDPDLARTPGNVRFRFAHGIRFHGNIFEHLGGVGLEFDTGSQANRIEGNLFTDISSAAIQLGGIAMEDHHPESPHEITRENVISNNLIRHVAREFVDAAGIFVGFTQHTTIRHNTIVDVPWSGIAMGWGWGLFDPGCYLGLPHATLNMWGEYDTPTPNRHNKIVNNRIHSFLNVLWDGGAIYTTGQQGTSLSDGLLIEGNVADAKLPRGGGNIFYTDGGSRYIRLKGNVSCNNAVGFTNLGPPPNKADPLPYKYIPPIPYGGDSGGCRTYGQIHYAGNYWQQTPMPVYEALCNDLYKIIPLFGFGPYSANGFFSIAPYTNVVNKVAVSYPTELTYSGNQDISGVGDVPQTIQSDAGVRKRPATIPPNRWILPPAVSPLAPVLLPPPPKVTLPFAPGRGNQAPSKPPSPPDDGVPMDVDW